MHKFPFCAFQDVALRDFFERSQQFSAELSSARIRQGEANAEPRQGQIMPPSHMRIRALWWAVEDISLNSSQFCVRFAYKIQCYLREKNKIGKFCRADAAGTERNNSEMVHGQKHCLLKTKAESKSIPSNAHVLKNNTKPTNQPPPST